MSYIIHYITVFKYYIENVKRRNWSSGIEIFYRNPFLTTLLYFTDIILLFDSLQYNNVLILSTRMYNLFIKVDTF